MKKLIFTLTLFTAFITLGAQDFFRDEYSREKQYVLLANPTAGNIAVIKFLLDKGILDIDLTRIEFVGVYHSSQEYDFSKAAEYIEQNNLSAFHLNEVRGVLTEETVYRENGCTEEFRNLFQNSAGIIFFGGQDIPPSLYGEENWYSETTDPGRHLFEVSFLFHLLGSTRNITYKPLLDENPGYMVTGFCLGLQSMNVATGGNLYQDVPAQVYNSFKPETNVLINRNNLHRNYWQNIRDDADFMGTNIHPIRFSDNSFFGNTVKTSRKLNPLVYSSHHQAIKDVARDFSVTAFSDDGKIVEGIVHRKYPNVFSVQFHPEVSALYEDRSRVKFAPEDEPATLHSMLDRNSLKFHMKYWKHISRTILMQTR